MHGDLLLFLFVVVFGCAAFFFGLIYLLCKVIGGAARGMAGVFGWERRGHRRICGKRGLVCPREGCGKMEHRAARFCSQCGARLPAPGVVVKR